MTAARPADNDGVIGANEPDRFLCADLLQAFLLVSIELAGEVAGRKMIRRVLHERRRS